MLGVTGSLEVLSVLEGGRELEGFPFVDFLRIVMTKIPMEDFGLVCWLAWKLWSERSKVVHETEGSNSQAILDLGIVSFGEWRALHLIPVQQQVVGSEFWLPPQPGYLKLNVDTMVSLRSDHIGMGAIIRDENGRISTADKISGQDFFSFLS